MSQRPGHDRGGIWIDGGVVRDRHVPEAVRRVEQRERSELRWRRELEGFVPHRLPTLIGGPDLIPIARRRPEQVVDVG